ncbi:MAG: peptidylprolyl isomerase [Campylobacterota bacterium]
MYKFLISLLLGSTLSFASVVNGIALTVNEEPITLYDIKKSMSKHGISKGEAVNKLVDEILYEQLVKQNNITADVLEVNSHIEKLAASKGMDVYSFKSIVRQQFASYEDFEKQAKDAVIREKLISKVVQGNIKVATTEDMKLYYENNIDEFKAPKTVEVTQYSSKNRQELQKTQKNPMFVSNRVTKNEISLDTKRLNPKMLYILNQTKKGQFTPIFTANSAYNTLYIKDKIGVTNLEFETVKEQIFREIMTAREKNFLKDLFEKERLTADIKIKR